MEKKFYAITFSGAHHVISEETANNILQASNDDRVEFDDGSLVKVSQISEVMPSDKYEETFPQKVGSDMHQPYSDPLEVPQLSWDEIKALPGQGFDSIIDNASRDSIRRERNLKALLRGLHRAKDKFTRDGKQTPNIDLFIKKVQEKLNIKLNVVEKA